MKNHDFKLSIVTTTDRDISVFLLFFEKIKEFYCTSGYQLEFIVVDDLAVIGDRCWADMVCGFGGDEFFYSEIVRPPKRVGQEQAILMGVGVATGHALMVIDPDMHANVSDIKKFVTELQRGKQVVFGRRVDRYDVHFFRIFSSRIYNLMAKSIGRTWVGDINTPMLLVSRAALDALDEMPKKAASHKLYLVNIFRESISEVRIETGYGLKKNSSYSKWMLFVTYLSRLRDLFLFGIYLRSKPKKPSGGKRNFL